jgi:tight adherence protein C
MLTLTYLITVSLVLYGLLLMKKEKEKVHTERMALVFGRKHKEEVGDAFSDELKKLSFFQRVIEPTWKKTKRMFQKNLTNEKMEKLELKLLQAGNPFGMTPVEFRMVQLVLVVMFPLLAVGYGFLLNTGGGSLFLLIIGAIVASLYVPRFYLKQKAATRNKRALKELPDFLDLLTVSIEAGLGFDSALSKVVAKKEGVLSTEFQRCLEEMRLGKTRREALIGVRNRIRLDDVHSLIGSIVQAEQLGIGVVQVLSVQSSEIRSKRKQRAEEAAMKAPIKMLFPLVIFIFPCIFIILLGPAIIQILETF